MKACMKSHTGKSTSATCGLHQRHMDLKGRLSDGLTEQGATEITMQLTGCF